MVFTKQLYLGSVDLYDLTKYGLSKVFTFAKWYQANSLHA